jgi:hypothetical protein
MDGAVSTSASNPITAVHRRGGIKYDLDLPAPSSLSLSPHVEVVTDSDDAVSGWELSDL